MKMSRVEAGMRAALQFYEAFNRHDVAGMMQLMSDDCLLETGGPAPDGTVVSGKDAVAGYWEDLFNESAGAQIEIEEIFGLGMRCIARWRFEWGGVGGVKESVRGVDILRIKSGLISERLSYIKG